MKHIKLQGQRQRNFPFKCLKRRKLAQREQVISLRTHEFKWFQSTLHRITVPLLRILASLQVRFYLKTVPLLLILLPSVGPAVIRYHSLSDFSGWRCCIVSPSVFVTLLIIRAVKGPSVSKKPDETNNIMWPKWRHLFTREEWNIAVSTDQKLGNMFYGFHCAPFGLLAVNETKCKTPIIASFLPKLYIFSGFPLIVILSLYILKVWCRFKYLQITLEISVNLLYFYRTFDHGRQTLGISFPSAGWFLIYWGVCSI